MNETNPIPSRAPNGPLEQALIEEFLRRRGYDSRSVEALPEDARRRLLREASIHAAGRLTEVEARAHLIHELHGDAAIVENTHADRAVAQATGCEQVQEMP